MTGGSGDATDPQHSPTSDPGSQPTGSDPASAAPPSWLLDEPARRIARALVLGVVLGMFLLRSGSRR